MKSGGVFIELLAVAFIVLKLLNQIDWAWYWVLAPVWIPLCICAIILFFVLRKDLSRLRSWRL